MERGVLYGEGECRFKITAFPCNAGELIVMSRDEGPVTVEPGVAKMFWRWSGLDPEGVW